MNKISPRISIFLSRHKFINKGHYLFLIGLIFLPSALPISAIFLFTALIISLRSSFREFNLNKINFLLIIVIILMLISNFRYLFSSPAVFVQEDNSSIWIDLFNWIPLFFCYWGFQSYLKTEKNRELVAKALIISSLPVIASCIGQVWFDWYGPFTTLNGLIVWFNKSAIANGITGLFSNPNYAGFWLASIWPFAVFSLSERKKNIFLILNLSLITYFLILTNSRNAILGILFSTILLVGIKVFLIIALFLIIFLISLLSLNNFVGLEEEILNNFIPYRHIKRFTNFAFLSNRIPVRLDVFYRAINFIKLRPIWGWGASIFPIIYLSSGGDIDIQHTHNINLELAFNYGIPVSLLLTYFISNILVRSFKLIFFDKKYNSIINKSWYSSTLIVILYNLTDVTYYDGKFSLLSWILLAGLQSIIKSCENNLICEI
ncbi:hypothetical protein CU304_06245 [Prochlorococcus marinus str. MU1415]|nr:hypothetical protein [Prochlorococcus marinus str. MU1415]